MKTLVVSARQLCAHGEAAGLAIEPRVVPKRVRVHGVLGHVGVEVGPAAAAAAASSTSPLLEI